MKQLDVLLINPGSRHAQYQGLGSEFSAVEPPSLAGLFATYLRKRGQSVEIIDAAAEDYVPSDVAKLVSEGFKPTLVTVVVYGFQPSASTQNMDAANATARAIKELSPECRILFTGTHPAALPARTLAENDAIDYVCSGEGPRTISSLAAALAAGVDPRGANIPDLWSRRAGVAMKSGASQILIDESELDKEMPGVAWDLLPMDKYRCHNWHAFDSIHERAPYASMHTSLGCPYACTFCCINAPFGKSSYRMWSADVVIKEIEHLYTAYGVRNIKFVDEMFVLNQRHVTAICEGLHALGIGKHLNIWAYARVDTVKDEYLDVLRRGGVRWLALGIESASKHVRDGVSKGRFVEEDILKVVRKIQAAGIYVIGNYIFGLPDDTTESMRDTLQLAQEANCEFANFYSAMAYPGSKLYTMARDKGWKLPDTWIGYSQHSYETEPLPTATLSGREVLAYRDHAFQSYFRSASYLDGIRRKFGQIVVDHLGRMVEQPLPRRLLRVVEDHATA